MRRRKKKGNVEEDGTEGEKRRWRKGMKKKKAESSQG